MAPPVHRGLSSSKGFNFPLFMNAAVVSHLVKAWNPDSATRISGLKVLAISRMFRCSLVFKYEWAVSIHTLNAICIFWR